MVLLLNAAFLRISHYEFVALADADADYIRDSIEAEHENTAGVPAKTSADFLGDAQTAQTKFLADHPDQFAGVKVQFQRPGTLDARHEAVTVPINSRAELTLIRKHPRLRDVLLQPISLGALTAFWTLWLALTWAVTSPYLSAQRFWLLGSVATSLPSPLLWRTRFAIPLLPFDCTVNYWNKPSRSARD
jgi:hypothetical protein